MCEYTCGGLRACHRLTLMALAYIQLLDSIYIYLTYKLLILVVFTFLDEGRCWVWNPLFAFENIILKQTNYLLWGGFPSCVIGNTTIVLKDSIPHIIILVLEHFPNKGWKERFNNNELDENGCQKFVKHHIKGCENILSRFEEVHQTQCGTKSIYGLHEVLVVEYIHFFGRIYIEL